MKNAKKTSVKPQIEWVPELVDIRKIKPTPKNYKIKTDLGRERLQTSLKKFGLASTVVVNSDYVLIDGNSRLEQEKSKGSKKIWVSKPKRKLTPKEFSEMSAMFDFAVAGVVDEEGIKRDLGTSEQFYRDWHQAVPLELLNKLGANAPKVSSGKAEPGSTVEVPKQEEVFTVQLFFNEKEEAAFRKMEDVLKVKFKTDSTTDTVLKAFKFLTKK